MIDEILLFAILTICFLLWLQNFALTKIIHRVDRQNQELRQRVACIEDYMCGTDPMTTEFWEGIKHGK